VWPVSALGRSVSGGRDFGRCRALGGVCPRYVLPVGSERYDARVGCLAQSPVAALAGPDFRAGFLAGLRCLVSRDQAGARGRSRPGQLPGPSFRLRSARTHPGSSVTGRAACVSSRSRVRSGDAGGQDPAALVVFGAGQAGPCEAVCAVTSARVWFGAGRGFGIPGARCRDAGGRRLGLRRGRRAR
jgi:hypothetical protein